jgi:hypothetical protein
MALLVTASLNFPNSWARKHSPHRPTPPATTTTAPPPHFLQEAADPAAMERRPSLSSGESSAAEEEQLAPQPPPPQEEEDEAAAMVEGTGAQVRGFGIFFLFSFFLEKICYTRHRYFVSFAEIHGSIVSLPEHTALLKIESLAHFLQNWSSQIKVPNFLFLTLWCVLANASQNCNGIWQRHN